MIMKEAKNKFNMGWIKYCLEAQKPSQDSRGGGAST